RVLRGRPRDPRPRHVRVPRPPPELDPAEVTAPRRTRMSEREHWEKRYRDGDSPWDTGQPSGELVRVLREERIAPCRALELGCGPGPNAVWLGRRVFAGTAVDLAPRALARAEERAEAAGVRVGFAAANVLDPPDLGGPFPFFFDRGCYHVVRRLEVD